MASKFKMSWQGDKVMLDLSAIAEKNVGFGAIYLKGKIKEKLSGNRSGRVYRVPGTKTLYTASAPGEPPASRLGTLRNSIISRFNKNLSDTIEARVGPKPLGPTSATPGGYPFWLEFGTKTMQPRPFMLPVFNEEAGAVGVILRKGWS